jgi:hypothetical protein
VRDLPPIDRVAILEDPDRVIVHVVAVKEEKAPAEAEGVEVVAEDGEAEPEVMTKGKKEDEGGES